LLSVLNQNRVRRAGDQLAPSAAGLLTIACAARAFGDCQGHLRKCQEVFADNDGQPKRAQAIAAFLKV